MEVEQALCIMQWNISVRHGEEEISALGSMKHDRLLESKK